MAANKVTKANEDGGHTVVERVSEAAGFKPKQPSRSVVKPLSGMRSEMELALADIGVVRETDVAAIVEHRLTKWSDTVQLQMIKAV